MAKSELELAKAKAKAKAKAANMEWGDESESEEQFAPGQTHQRVDGRTVPIEQEQLNPDQSPSQVDALALGAIEGVPFAKDALSAGEAVFGQESDDSFGERYNKNMQQWDSAINEAEAKHPVTFTIGDVASGFAVPAAKGIKGMAALGAISGVSRSEDRDIWDAVAGATISAGLGTAVNKGMEFVAGRLNVVGRKFGLIADETTKSVLDSGKNRKVLNSHIEKFWQKDKKGNIVKTAEEASSEFAEFLTNKTVAKRPLIEATDTSATTFTKMGKWKDEVSSKIDDVLTKSDRVLDDQEVLSMYNAHKAALGIDDLLEAGGDEGTRKAAKLMKKLDEHYVLDRPSEMKPMEVLRGFDKNGNAIKVTELVEASTGPMKFRKMTIKGINKKKKFFSQTAENSFDKKSGTYLLDDVDFYKKGSGVLATSLEDLTEDITDETSKGLLKNLNREWATANIGQELSGKLAKAQNADIVEKIKSIFNMRSAFIAGSAVGGFALGGGVGSTTSTGIAVGLLSLNSALRDPRTPAKSVARLRALSQHLQINPDSKYLKRLVVASGLSSDNFREALAGTTAELALMAESVFRTTDDAFKKSDDILSAVQFHNKEMAGKLRQAFERDDRSTVAALMDQLSKDPNTKDFIQEGFGWDNTVWSPEDKAIAIDQLMNNDKISFVERLLGKKRINETGKLEEIAPQKDRFEQYTRRNKSEPEF